MIELFIYMTVGLIFYTHEEVDRACCDQPVITIQDAPQVAMQVYHEPLSDNIYLIED